MSSKSFPVTLGLTVGGLLAVWHATWSLLVALGWAQPLMDWILRLHMIQLSFQVLPFDIGSAVTLVIVTGVFGFILGWIAGSIWEACKR